MSVQECRERIKKIVDSTDDELLLRYWEKQLTEQSRHQSGLELSEEELNMVEEGLADYKAGNVMSLRNF